MRNTIHSMQRQGGAVAIIVGLSIFVLVGFLALVLDLGHLYIAKTELQNAADAAALAGAKELDGTRAGVTSARNWAIEAADKNKYDLNSLPVDIAAENIEFSSSPDGGWVSFAAAQDNPGGKTFLKVDTGPRTLPTWFARIWNILETKTFGMAVAGRDIIDLAPMGVCAVDRLRPEQGFIRGVAYNAVELNPLANADQMWINPVNAPPDTCAALKTNWNSTAFMAPFVCTGKSAVVRALPGQVFLNTGVQAGLDKELNSRFDIFGGGSRCDATTAPPDTNIMEYRYNATGIGGPGDWMNPNPTRQGIEIRPRNAPADPNNPPNKPFNYPTRSSPEIGANFSRYGALWSYSGERNVATGEDYTLCDWSTTVSTACPTTNRTTNLYGGEADQTSAGYPTTFVPPATFATPYSQKSGRYFKAPTRAGMTDRRVLSLLIIDCSVPPLQVCSSAGKQAQVLTTIAVGKFFMPVKANLEATPKELFLEFISTMTTMPPAGIKLYK